MSFWPQIITAENPILISISDHIFVGFIMSSSELPWRSDFFWSCFHFALCFQIPFKTLLACSPSKAWAPTASWQGSLQGVVLFLRRVHSISLLMFGTLDVCCLCNSMIAACCLCWTWLFKAFQIKNKNQQLLVASAQAHLD